jgi:hypothetical protein
MKAYEHKRIFRIDNKTGALAGGGPVKETPCANIIFETDIDGGWYFKCVTYQTTKREYTYADWMFLREVANEVERLSKELNAFTGSCKITSV